MKNIISFLFLFISFACFAQQEFYELRTYEMKFGGDGNALHSYLKDAYIPASKRNGALSVGVFNEYSMSNPAKLYVLTAYKSLADYDKVYEALKTDKVFLQAKSKYDNLPNDKVPYTRISISLFKAFSGMTKLVKPATGSSLFELRTYEGINEAAFARKIEMFNKEELALFEETKLHSVFFGEMLAGNSVPALTYLLGFKDMAEREANWKVFIDHPEWKRISSDPQYANSVSNIIRVFLVPTAYSEI
jgi:hypothetical protein